MLAGNCEEFTLSEMGELEAGSNNNSVMDTVTEEHQPSTSSSFTVDSSCIATVPAEEQAEELRLLGLSVYNQATFEHGVLEQVDRAFQKEEAEKNEKKQQIAELTLSSVIDDIRLVKVRLKHLEKALSIIPPNLISSNKQAKRQVEAIQKEKENKLKQLKSLRAKHRSITSRFNVPPEQLETDGESGGEVELDLETKNQLDKILGLCQESEQERLIRTGQMTPFGTMLSRPQQARKIQLAPTMTDFEKYLLDQESLQNNKRQSPAKSNKADESKSDNKRLSGRNQERDLSVIPSTSKDIPPLMPPKSRKRRRKEDVGTITVETAADLKKIRRKPFWWPDPEANTVDLDEIGKDPKSSDSEYAPSAESTDEDEEETNLRRKISGNGSRSKKNKKGSDNSLGKKSRILDDGNQKDYIKRIK